MKTLILSLVALTLFAPHAHATEPTIDEVREHALRYAGLHRSVDRWSTRARLRNLLPEVSLGVGRLDQLDDNTQFDEWLRRDADQQLLWDSARNQTELNHRDHTDFTIRATFDVRGLLFDRDELAATREARARHEARLHLMTMVEQVYFERRQAADALRAMDPRLIDRRRDCARHVEELDARIDGLTGGWYGRARRGER